jgi:hypothetical protein
VAPSFTSPPPRFSRLLGLAYALLLTLPLLQAEVLTDLNRIIQLQASRPGAEAAGPDISKMREQAIANNPQIFYANPGPWGKLRCTFIYLEAPQAMVDAFPIPNSKTSWCVPSSDLTAFVETLRTAEVPQEIVEQMTASGSMVSDALGLNYLFPPHPFLEAMSPRSRTVIYSKLAQYPNNEFYTDPVLIIGQSPQDWFRTSKMRPALIDKISKLTYSRGDTLAFSDVSLLLNDTTSESEARQAFKALTRTRALMVKVEVPPGSDILGVVNYWSLGLGLRRKDVEPLLQSVQDTNGLESLPLSHLLPPLARKLIYTYPSLDMSRHGTIPDCHWTCLNFFNYEPHEYLLDSRLATSAVLERFAPVEPPYTYGDILFFLSKDTGDAYHSCIYLADNLVYTKNGRNLLAPWLIMRREDVEKIYLYRGDGRIQGYRLKKQ